MEKKTLILKIGGSVLTRKEKNSPELRRETALEIARELAKAYDPEKFRLILIHGGGSFGHILSKKYGLENGTKDHPEKSGEALEVQDSVKKLHEELLFIFRSSGLPIASFPTHKVTTNREGKIEDLHTDGIEQSLNQGKIPLLHGDMIPDSFWGYSICSGDGLSAKLAETFCAETVLFASDVDGIFTKDPHLYRDAILIPETSLQEIISGKIKLGASHNTDVTGGLSTKFSLFQNFPKLKNIFLFNGMQTENFSAVFENAPVSGTRIRVS